MRLLNTETLRLETLPNLPDTSTQYAILSHTWDEDEVLFDDIFDQQKPLPTHKKGFEKVKESCEQAAKDGFNYIWIDTCCIDKSSSAELSEAINSMFQWYHYSDRCYAYLSDVNIPESEDRPSKPFEESRWFTRGWTLQELIAPRDVRFYDCQWNLIGSRQPHSISNLRTPSLAKRLRKCTNIPLEILLWYVSEEERQKNPQVSIFSLDQHLRAISVAQRLSWAANRSTTRAEDEAYSPMGLFGVHMPLLYGEGRRAFFRLQEEIMKATSDQSILAFDNHLDQACNLLLADSPRCFASSEIEQSLQDGPTWPGAPPSSYELSPSSKAVDVGLFLCPLKSRHPDRKIRYLGILNCVYRQDLTSHPAIILREIDIRNNTFYRSRLPLQKITPVDQKGHIPLDTGFGGISATYAYDLSEAYFATARLSFQPPLQSKDLPTPQGSLRVFTPGIRIKFDKQLALSSSSSYPQTLQLKEGWAYAPSMLLSDWPRRSYGLDSPLLVDQLALFGVIVFHFKEFGTVAVSWGKICAASYGSSVPTPWCVIMDWSRFIQRSSIDEAAELTDLDLQKAATTMFLRSQGGWRKSLATPPGLDVEYENASGKVRCKIQTVEFFGRSLFEMDMTISPSK
ncbi:putative vegetative incompatibility protein HET-E-1 [Podospora fimiseda]|uniref:Vegetative incompatibility protein HET-E-1 n=1 Tax=Podospora fimiseda TaxID=252190 RepID=A0AAN7BN73_9PEZI|nr:putative vegetative incompatibility protein HET-E-1 [Podospora fimiseda]